MKLSIWEEDKIPRQFLELTKKEAEKLEEALRRHREGEQIHCIRLDCFVEVLGNGRGTLHRGRIQIGIVDDVAYDG
jgi:hypothetical protein